MNRRTLWSTLSPLIIGAVVAVGAYYGITEDSTSEKTTKASASTPATDVQRPQGIPECELDTLPAQAREVTGDILAGGPFDYPGDDGGRFGNYEGILPQENTSYYREYTVETPGENDRGARRIVTGGGSQTDPDLWYYTDDHYASFCLIPDAEE